MLLRGCAPGGQVKVQEGQRLLGVLATAMLVLLPLPATLMSLADRLLCSRYSWIRELRHDLYFVTYDVVTFLMKIWPYGFIKLDHELDPESSDESS